MALTPITTTVSLGTTTSTSGNRRTTTETSLVTTQTPVSERFDNGITDISIIPYMQNMLVNFTAEGLRPNRRVFFYFDDTNVTDYISPHIEVLLTQNDANTLVQAGFSNNDVITGNTNLSTATVVQGTRFFDFVNSTPSLQDDARRRTRRRILRLANASGRFANAEGFVTNRTTIGGSIGAIRVQGGQTLRNFFENTTSNTITLPAYTQDVANNYWGTDSSNTIILMANRRGSRSRAVRAYITGFNNVTQVLSLSNTLSDIITSNPSVTIPTSNTVIGAQETTWAIANGANNFFMTDFEGKISGTFSIPAGVFRTGERIFRIIDAFENDPADATTRADYKFDSSGIKATKNDVVINSVVTTQEVVTSTRTQTISRDPVAQTFFVNEAENPNGVFISSVGLYVRSKDEIIPLQVEIRPTVNGFPASYEVVPSATASLSPDYITVTEDASVETRFKFDTPIYLPPGEWALVVKSDSLNYEIFVAELGSKIIGTNRIVSEQPYLGSFFKSQNASTWDAIQLEDMTFNLYRCQFDTSGTVTLYNEAPLNNVVADVLFTHMDDLRLPNTRIAYTHSYDAGVTTSNYDIDSDIVPDSRVSFYNQSSNVGKYRLTASLTTSDRSVSPLVYTQSGKTIAVENYVDNAELSTKDFTILKTGSGYDANANLTLSLTGLAGTGAEAHAVANATGHITNVYIKTPGSGYTQNVTVASANGVAIAANGEIFVANGNNAQIAVSSELDASGGPASAKYISRVATLASGFEATDLRVFLTAYKPSGTDIKVYYKVKSPNDPDDFNAKGYQLMAQRTASGVYSTKEGFSSSAIEYEFEPVDSQNVISYTSGTATYDTFNQFALKIVLLSDTTTQVPVVYDMRAVALP